MRRTALVASALLMAILLLSCRGNELETRGGGLNNPPETAEDFSVAGNLSVAGESRFSDSVRLLGAGTDYEDLRIDGLSTRTGSVAPTDETGFRGSANFYSRNLVHNQADEVQFSVQMPHAWRAGSGIYPHVHMAPWASSTGSQTAQFQLECYNADVGDTFPAVAASYEMSTTWTTDKQWAHLIAGNDQALAMTGLELSSILKCRLYRDNTVGGNYANKVSLLYFDIHYEVDAFGSDEEYIK